MPQKNYRKIDGQIIFKKINGIKNIHRWKKKLKFFFKILTVYFFLFLGPYSNTFYILKYFL